MAEGRCSSEERIPAWHFFGASQLGLDYKVIDRDHSLRELVHRAELKGFEPGEIHRTPEQGSKGHLRLRIPQEVYPAVITSERAEGAAEINYLLCVPERG